MKTKTITYFAVASLFWIIILYSYAHTLDIKAPQGTSRESIHVENGQPCGTFYFKCCGIEKAGEMASSYDAWENNTLLGIYKILVYYDQHEKTITTENSFQWFFEPALYDLKKDSSSCLYYM